MTRDELATQLNGTEYPVRISKELGAQAKAAGLVVVYGASDDLMEFEGAIHEEFGAYGGTIEFVDAVGTFPDFDDLCDSKDFDGLYGYFGRYAKRHEIEAIWDGGDGYSWTYKTDIPHATFEVTEDGEPYCCGIVFSLADLGPATVDPSA